METILPMGIVTKHGVAKRIVLRRLSGETRIGVGDKKYENDTVGLKEFLLRQSIEGVYVPQESGEEVLSPFNDVLLSNMLIGDSDAVLLRSRSFSLGDSVDHVVTCPACQKQSQFTLKLSELEILEKPAKVDHNSLVFDLELDTGELAADGSPKMLAATFRYPQMSDLRAIQPKTKQNLTAAEADMWWRTLVAWDGKVFSATEQPSKNHFAKTPLYLNNDLADKYREALPGVDTEVEGLDCYHCSYKLPYNVQLADYFFGSAGRRERRNAKRA